MEESSGKGKTKVENCMSEDMQEPLPSLKKEEVSENGSTASCFTGENTTQLIHQPSDHVSLANPLPRVQRVGHDKKPTKRSMLTLREVGKPSNLLSNEFNVLDTSAIFFANMAKNGNANNTNGNFNFKGTVEGGSGKGKAKIEDMQEPENESVLVEDSSSFTGENTPLLIHQPSDHDVTLVNSSGDNAAGSAPLSVTNPLPRFISTTSRKNGRFSPYLACTYCRRRFRTRWGLNRHQLTHNQPKDQRPPPIKLLPVLDTSAMFFENMMKMGNANNTIGNLQGFGAPNTNINSMGGGLNSIGMVDCPYRDYLTRLIANSCFPPVGFKGAGTSDGVVGNCFGSSQDEGEVRGEDATIDLLSRVGMESGENDKSDSKGGDEDDES